MDTPQDLLEAICIQPDDDALRERYATMITESSGSGIERLLARGSGFVIFDMTCV